MIQTRLCSENKPLGKLRWPRGKYCAIKDYAPKNKRIPNLKRGRFPMVFWNLICVTHRDNKYQEKQMDPRTYILAFWILDKHNAKRKGTKRGQWWFCRNRRGSKIGGGGGGLKFLMIWSSQTGYNLWTDIVVDGNEITVRNAQFRLPNSFLQTIQLKPNLFLLWPMPSSVPVTRLSIRSWGY